MTRTLKIFESSKEVKVIGKIGKRLSTEGRVLARCIA